jgi:V-type H+-transporting ATPase subunit a
MDVVRFLEQTEIKAHQRPSALVLKELDELLSEKEQELNDLNGYHANLTREYNERVELKHVLSKARLFFSPEYQTEAREVYADPEVAMPLVERICKFNFVTGVVSAENKSNFERQIFRSTRGNCLMRFEDIEEEILDPQTGLAVNKVVFIIFFQAPSIEPKLRRSCDAFGAHRYDIPDLDNVEEVDELMLNTRSDIDDRARVLKRNRDNLMQLLREDIAVQLEQWHCVIKREKAVFHTLNMFKTDVPGFLRGEAWVVSESAVAAAAILRDTAKVSLHCVVLVVVRSSS